MLFLNLLWIQTFASQFVVINKKDNKNHNPWHVSNKVFLPIIILRDVCVFLLRLVLLERLKRTQRRVLMADSGRRCRVFRYSRPRRTRCKNNEMVLHKKWILMRKQTVWSNRRQQKNSFFTLLALCLWI